MSFWVLLRYWVRFQRNCFILWAISTFLKCRHLPDPVPQIPLKCFCQDGSPVLDHVLLSAQAGSREKTLRHMVQTLAFLSEQNLCEKTSEFKKSISAYDVRMFTVSLLGTFSWHPSLIYVCLIVLKAQLCEFDLPAGEKKKKKKPYLPTSGNGLQLPSQFSPLNFYEASDFKVFWRLSIKHHFPVSPRDWLSVSLNLPWRRRTIQNWPHHLDF